MDRLINCFILIILCAGCKAQQSGTDAKLYSKEIVTESIWVPRANEESYGLKISDTADKKLLHLIFERQFNDTVKVLLNKKELYLKSIRTSELISVVDEEFTIDYSNSKNPIIEIFLNSQKKKITFSPKLGYRYGYLNRHDNVWTLEFSNYQRIYY